MTRKDQSLPGLTFRPGFFLNATFCICLSFSPVLGLCAAHGLSLVVVFELFTVVSSLAVEHKLKGARAPRSWLMDSGRGSHLQSTAQ